MHDIKAIRENPQAWVAGWSARGVPNAAKVVEDLIWLDDALRKAQTAGQTALARRNEVSKLIGAAKGRKDEAEAQRLMAEVEALKAEITEREEVEGVSRIGLKEKLERLPQIAAPDVPSGADEYGNVEQHRRGTPRAIANPKDHADLGEALGFMDFEAAARMSGSRFVVLKGQLARLERAIGQFMLDLQTEEHGYTEVNPPLLVRDQALYGTGQLPKFEDDLFFTARLANWGSVDDILEQRMDDFWLTLTLKLGSGGLGQLKDAVLRAQSGAGLDEAALAAMLSQYPNAKSLTAQRFLIPTAEVSLTNLVREQIVAEEELPLRLTALTACFRAEAGSAGRDTRGMIRQHQFYKVELVSITTPEQSDEEHERMVSCAEAVLEKLELPYRRMLLCTGDMGFTARKTFDLEVWLPSQNTYREISSCSNCGDFQARRMDARSRKAGEKGGRFVHTLNGSGLAVGRTLVAIMENYQQDDGRIAVPAVLQPYMGGVSMIGGSQ